MSRWVNRFSGHAVSAETAAEKILAGVAKNRYLVYTSPDIRALYAFKRLAWWPYSLVMRQVNVIFKPRTSAQPRTATAAWPTRVAPRVAGSGGRARTGPGRAELR